MVLQALVRAASARAAIHRHELSLSRNRCSRAALVLKPQPSESAKHAAECHGSGKDTRESKGAGCDV
jgi:hypothetical protein